MKTRTNFLLAAFLLHAAVFAQSPDSVWLSLEPGQLIFPGNNLSVGLSFASVRGDTDRTRGLLGGRIQWRKLYVESSVDARVRNGILRIPRDLSLVKNRYFTVRVYDRRKKRLYYEGSVPYNFPVRVKPQMPAEFTKAPGFQTPFSLAVQWDNDTVTTADGQRGLLSLSDFNYYVKGGEVARNRLHISPDVQRFADNHTVAVYASARDFVIPESEATSFLLDYKARYRFARFGWRGSDGWNGGSGQCGPTGGRGGDGGWGAPGDDGHRGPDLRVEMDAHFDETLQATLVDVKVTDLNGGSRIWYRVNAEQGKVRVESQGGSGGDGGRGGNGGDGGRGEDGREEKIRKKVNDSTFVEETIRHRGGPGGDGGNGGNGGPGGFGGDGGDIYVSYTAAARPYLHVLEARSSGGSGGSGGFGGSAGSGGSGGRGEPGGRNGCSGRSGGNGPWGQSGRDGQVRLRLVPALEDE